MKYVHFILLLLLLACCKNNSTVDGDNLSPVSQEIASLIAISKDSLGLTTSQRAQYLQRAEAFAEDIDNDTLRLNAYSKISLAYKSIQDSTAFRTLNNKLQQWSQEAKLYKTLGESHWDLASFFRNYGVLDSAYYHFRSAYRSFDKLPTDPISQSLRGRMLYGMGQMQDSYKDYLGAEVSITQALRIFDDLDDQPRIYNCYNVLGIIATGMGNGEKSLEYFEKAKDQLNNLDSNRKSAFIWQNQNNVSNELLRMEQYPDAINSYEELISDRNLREMDPKLYSLASSSYAYAIFKSKNNAKSVEEYLTTAMHINDSIGEVYNQSRVKQFYAELLMSEGDTAQAVQYALEARDIAQQTSNNDRSLEVLRLLTQWDYQNAVAYSNAYYDLSETIKEEERAKRDKFARIRLETEEVIEENKFLTRQRKQWIAGAMALILVGIATMVIVTQRIRYNRLKFEQQQQESNQEIYNLMLSQQGKLKEGKQMEQKRISEELHDGVLSDMLGIRLMLSGLNEKEDPKAVDQRARFIEKLRGVEEEIRTISHELNDASYKKFYDFIVSLDNLIEEIEAPSGIACNFVCSPKVDWDSLEGDTKINIYRITQESLQNCVKHAKCSNVNLLLTVDEGELELSITDDGIGFEPSKGKRGIGLRNVTSRVKKLNGTVEIDSAVGKGTTILVRIPTSATIFDDPDETRITKQAINV